MAAKHIRQTNHDRHSFYQQPSDQDSDCNEELNDETDPEGFDDDDTDAPKIEDFDDDNDVAVYSDDSPDFYLDNNDEDIGLTVSENEEGHEHFGQPHYRPSVINYMPSQSPESDFSDNELATIDGDSDSMEKEEEEMIHDEFDKDESANNSAHESTHDSDSSSSSDYLNFYDRPTQQASGADQQLEEDDSYLWEYFFTSEEDEPAQAQEYQAEEHSESTDEELNLPSPKRSNRRAVEVLGANSQMRPPVLGSWNIENSNGNVGIIDGLTTRTLSPPHDGGDDDMDANQTWQSDSDNEEPSNVQMDEFLNTEDFDDEEDYVTTPLYRSRFNKNVPLSAFRNRSSPYTVSYDPMRRRRRSFGRDGVIISPVRSLRKRPKARRRRPSHSQDLGDLEFIDLGGMTPLFEI